MQIGVYTVTRDANSLEGWTVGSLAEALRGPLGALGIEVGTAPNQVGGGGLSMFSDLEGSVVEAMIQDLVERVVVDGPEGLEGRVQDILAKIKEVE